jgi:ABC-type multidrug transport system fused ATPase/permease subunit
MGKIARLLVDRFVSIAIASILLQISELHTLFLQHIKLKSLKITNYFELMFQFNCLLLLILGIGINYFVILFPNASFQYSIAYYIIIILFLLFCLGLNYWVFFTSSGRAYARKYNKKQAKQAEIQKKYLEKLKNQPLIEKEKKERQGKEELEQIKIAAEQLQEDISLFNNRIQEKFGQLKIQFDEGKEITDEFEAYRFYPIGQFYESALDLIVTYNGDIKVKLFALKVGRLHFGRGNLWQKTSTHDEQTIQNDINARC